MSAYLIPEQFIPELEKKIARISKKASKLGVAPVSMTLGETRTMQTRGSHRIGTPILTYNAVEVEVTGHAPVIEGWRFVAVVRHKRTGNEFHIIPSVILTPDEEFRMGDFRTSERRCDHCNMNRVRNATYLLLNEEGEYKLVGSTCLGDFTGYNDPQAAASACENIFKMFDWCVSYSRMTPRTTKQFFLTEWMAFVQQAVTQNSGQFVSRREAGENSTADTAKRAIIAYANGDDTIIPPTDPDFSMAGGMIEWAQSLRGTSDGHGDFMENLTAIMSSDMITEHDMGISAAVYAAHKRWTADQIRKAVQSSQIHIGTIGEKITVDVRVEAYNTFAGFNGDTTYVYKLVETNSLNKLLWFSTRRFDVGETFIMTATVKSHEIDSYSGDKQTKIGGRVKIV